MTRLFLFIKNYVIYNLIIFILTANFTFENHPENWKFEYFMFGLFSFSYFTCVKTQFKMNFCDNICNVIYGFQYLYDF